MAHGWCSPFSAAYSISGHVVISLSATSSLFRRRCAHRLLLRSLIVTFEGQSELLAPETTYSALRLCTVSQQLAPEEAVILSTEGSDSDEPCTWNVVFNLTVPGWLPPSAIFGDPEIGGDTGTRYALHASAKFDNVDDMSSSSWFSSFCNPFSFATLRTVKARKCPVQLNRLLSPASHASTSTSLFPSANYHVHAEPETHVEKEGKPHIPSHVLSAMRVVCTVPDHIGMEEESVPFTLRLRTTGLSESECRRLRITQFGVDLEQSERYRYVNASICQCPVWLIVSSAHNHQQRT